MLQFKNLTVSKLQQVLITAQSEFESISKWPKDINLVHLADRFCMFSTKSDISTLS